MRLARAAKGITIIAMSAPLVAAVGLVLFFCMKRD